MPDLFSEKQALHRTPALPQAGCACVPCQVGPSGPSGWQGWPGPAACSQSQRHVNTSTISGDKQLLLGSIMRPLVLKACSEDTVDTGITSTSRAKCDRTGYLYV
ncbi:hypothetical protein Ddye_017909 [Dipteronia dyeriana]|uniref:Uncharacterized protein n=1 Tax=Dipteronia dyeriana TaxID=168575 RepID=A0AAD9U9K1_9ROSI|nr:hypothetical protein Ddye_017909 [Dipteronia dyeriana]